MKITTKNEALKALELIGNSCKVPYGEYTVEIFQMGLCESPQGEPQVAIAFEVKTGEFAHNLIFVNQVITQGFQIHTVNELLRGLVPHMDIQFTNYRQYAELLEDVFTDADESEYAYVLEYGLGKCGLPTYEIIERYV
jgi:hypothetical protein